MRNILEIDLNQLVNNYNYIKSLTDARIIAVVKANAYGMGAIEVSKCLEKKGCDMFAVANYEEAKELIDAGIKSEILVFGNLYLDEFNLINCSKIIITLHSFEQFYYYYQYLKDEIKNFNFHIKINTGLNRLGFNYDELEKLTIIILEHGLSITGIYTHYANAEEDEEITNIQYEKFVKSVIIIKEIIKKDILIHSSNSAGTILNKKHHFGAVRVGMALYGLQPRIENDFNIKPIYRWKAPVIAIRDVLKGDRVSYGEFNIEKDMRIAILGIGYSDGLIRDNKLEVYCLQRNLKCDIIGKVCMDMIMVNVTEIKSLKIGDYFIIIDKYLRAEINAKNINTIADDIISKISYKTKRIYKWREIC